MLFGLVMFVVNWQCDVRRPSIKELEINHFLRTGCKVILVGISIVSRRNFIQFVQFWNQFPQKTKCHCFQLSLMSEESGEHTGDALPFIAAHFSLKREIVFGIAESVSIVLHWMWALQSFEFHEIKLSNLSLAKLKSKIPLFWKYLFFHK